MVGLMTPNEHFTTNIFTEYRDISSHLRNVTIQTIRNVFSTFLIYWECCKVIKI